MFLNPHYSYNSLRSYMNQQWTKGRKAETPYLEILKISWYYLVV